MAIAARPYGLFPHPVARPVQGTIEFEIRDGQYVKKALVCQHSWSADRPSRALFARLIPTCIKNRPPHETPGIALP